MPKVELVLTDAEMDLLVKALKMRGLTMDDFLKGDIRAALVKKMCQAADTWCPVEQWRNLVLGVDCSVCKDIAADAGMTEDGFKVCDLSISRLRLMRNQFVPGYCVLTSLVHVSEPYHLPGSGGRRYFEDLMRVGRTLERLFNPAKMNFELLGNGIPHLHCHIKPRYHGDISPRMIIDQNAGVVHLDPSQYEERCGAIRLGLGVE